MLKKGDKIKLEIIKLVFGGEGLGYYDGRVVFVPESVPGDVVEVEIVSSKKNYSRGVVNNFITKSVYRKTPKCEYFKECGACDFMMIDYPMQLVYKKNMTEEVINSVGKVRDYILDDTIGAENTDRYRNKIIQAFGVENGKIVSGFYKKRTHDIVDNDNCIIQTDKSNKILKKMKEILAKNGISIYNEVSKKGTLRNVMIRKNENEEYMLVAISNSKNIKDLEKVILEICDDEKSIVSAYISINTSGSNFVLGKKNIHIFGKKYLTESINGLDFVISPLSFFQIHTRQAEKMYDLAVDYFDNINEKIVVDAYSGTGTIGMILSKKAKQVYCIEIVEAACKDAESGLKRNNIDNVEIINGKVEEELINLIEQGVKIDSIIFDPPRKGLDPKIISKVNEANIKEIVYISCNGSSFARDVNVFSSYGYKLIKATPIDMFPNTNHIEIVAKIQKEE